jgi:midasin (ATPase involved in ribosome maturation)
MQPVMCFKHRYQTLFNTATHTHTHTHRADNILDTVKTHLYDLIMSIICSGQFTVRQFGHHSALTLKACWYFVDSCKDVIYIRRLEKHRSFIKSAQSQLFWSGILKMSTCVGTVLVLCRVDMSCTLWNALRSLVDISKIFIKPTV